MKTILFITNIMPFPGNSGGTIKTRKLIDGLIDKGYGIYLCFLDTNISGEEESNYWDGQYHNKLLGYYRVCNKNNVRSIKNYCQSVLKGLPLNIFRNYSIEMDNTIKALLLDKKIDVIIVDHLECAQFVPDSYMDKAILHEHNAEFKIWERYSSVQKNIIKKCITLHEAQRLKRYEIKMCDKYKNVMAAPKDILYLSDGTMNNKFFCSYHMGDDSLLEYPEKEYPQELNILFIGTLTWEANIQGVRWFLEFVLPCIEEKVEKYNVYIIGKYKKGTFDDLQKIPKVFFLGFVDCLEDYMKNAAVFICPLFFGSGMKIKLIEAMYRGIPFVTTEVGAESIVIVDQNQKYKYPYAGIVTNDPKAFSEAIIDIYENVDKWLSMSRTSRLIAEKEYRWIDEIDRFSKAIDEL